MTIKCVVTMLILSTALLLASCGSDGGKETNEPPSNDWDSMVWDQGNWA
ncbi:MAG TPA: hypothetical protein PKH39_14995 [Woeseiaceae bacterium]|nr:hypothetical protein [Woeseiaceae bacterium]